MKTWITLFTLVIALPFTKARAETPPATGQTAAPVKTPTVQRPQVVEVTFGNAQLFAHQSVLRVSGQPKEQVVPVTSALLMIEWLMRDRLSLLGLFNLPLATQKIFVDGQIREEFNAPSVAAGVRLTAVRLDLFVDSRLELQLATLAGVTLGSRDGDKVFPMVAGRLHFANHAGFALYLGGAFAFKKDTMALLYGIGHRF
jgi:hypothetical protein